MYYNINYILPLTDGESLYRHCACCSILFVYLYYIYLYMNKILFKSNQQWTKLLTSSCIIKSIVIELNSRNETPAVVIFSLLQVIVILTM